MMNDENTLADGVKGWLRDRGMTKSNLKSYKYWLPYTVAGGKAWTPQSMTFELTLRCNLSCQMCPLDRMDRMRLPATKLRRLRHGGSLHPRTRWVRPRWTFTPPPGSSRFKADAVAKRA